MRRHLARRLEQGFRVAAYAFIVYSGISTFVFPLRSYGAFSDALVFGWGGLQILFGIAALIAVASNKPLLEWRVIGLIAAGILLYALLGWAQVATEAPSHGARAGDITALVFLLAARFAFLWDQVETAEAEAEARERAREGDG